jgi:hypothetical protein
MNDQMRDEFVKFANHWRYDLTLDENDFYECAVTQRVWDTWSSAWNASRKSIIVDLSDLCEASYTYSGTCYKSDVEYRLEQAGVSCE